jgi:hypothetical protein
MGRTAWITAVAVSLLVARAARADEADDLRDRLTKDAAARESVMKALERSPARIGAVLGPLLRDRGVGTPSAYAAAWLCDHAPREGGPLLADEILRRAQDDAPWSEEMRALLAPEGTGWAALAGVARKRLLAAADDPSLAAAAAWALRWESTKGNAKDLVDAWASAPEPARAAADRALEFLVAHRFASADAARKWFAEHSSRSFVEWLRELSTDKDRPTSPLYARMLSEASRNLSKAETPAELRRYLVPSETPWVELRQAAARRAAAINAPGEAWLPVLVQVLREETDHAALASLLAVGRALRRSSGETAAELAHVVADRLQGCCTRPELAVGFLRVLGSVGDEKVLADAYDVVERSADASIQEAWLSAAGAVGGNARTIARFYASRQGRTGAGDVRLRTIALEALARGAGRSAADDSIAGSVLRSVLKRGPSAPESGPPRETALGPRLAAVRGLESFPDPETVLCLADAARDPAEHPSLAPVAIGVLGKLAAHGSEAVTALVEFVRRDGPVSVRAEAARDLAKALSDGPDEPRAVAIAAVRDALRPEAGPRALRVGALQAAAAFADPGALGPAFALAVEAARETPRTLTPDLQAALERLVQGVVRADERSDAAVARGVEDLAAAGALDASGAVADAAADAGAGRLRLQAARAGVLDRRARLAGRDAASRRDDLREADRVLRRAEQTATAAERGGEAWGAALLLHDGVLRSLLDDPATDEALRRSALLTALDVAARRGDPAGARRALESVDAARAMPLSPSERDALEKVVSALQAVAAAAAAPLPPR